jgi:hypothetical protein
MSKISACNLINCEHNLFDEKYNEEQFKTCTCDINYDNILPNSKECPEYINVDDI